MAAVPWPVGVPDCWQVDPYSEQERPTVIRSEIEVGQPRVRRRYIEAITDVSANLVCNGPQLRILLRWFNQDLSWGVRRFSAVSPSTGKAEEFRFKTPPLVSQMTKDLWNVALDVEML